MDLLFLALILALTGLSVLLVVGLERLRRSS